MQEDTGTGREETPIQQEGKQEGSIWGWGVGAAVSEKRRTVREAETKGASAGQRQRPLVGHYGSFKNAKGSGGDGGQDIQSLD